MLSDVEDLGETGDVVQEPIASQAIDVVSVRKNNFFKDESSSVSSTSHIITLIKDPLQVELTEKTQK